MKTKKKTTMQTQGGEEIKLKTKRGSSAYRIKLPKKIRNAEASDIVNSEGEHPQSTNQVISNSDSTSRQHLILPKKKMLYTEESDIDEEEVHFKFLDVIKSQENKTQIQSLDLEQLYAKNNIEEFNCFQLTVVSLFSGIMYHELKSYGSTYSVDNNLTNSAIYFSLAMVSISNALFIVSTINRYFINLEIKKVRREIVYAGYLAIILDTLYSSGRLKFLLIEILLCILHPSIATHNLSFTTNEDWYNKVVTYDVNDYLLIIALWRVYVFFRYYFTFTRYFDVRSSRVGKLLGTKINRVFALRCMMASSPYGIIIVSIVVFIFAYTFMVRIIEGPVWYIDQDSINFTVVQNCIWCVVVTMTTVGYGDYYPKTSLGRFILMVTVFTGTTIVSFMVVALTNFMKFTDNQIKANLEILKKDYQKRIEKASGRYFMNSIKLHMAQKAYNLAITNPGISQEQKDKHYRIVTECLYMKIKSKKYFTHIMHKFRNIFDPYDETEILRDKIFTYLGVLNYTLVTSKSNEEITQYIKEIVQRIRKLVKQHSLSEFKQLKRNLQLQ